MKYYVILQETTHEFNIKEELEKCLTEMVTAHCDMSSLMVIAGQELAFNVSVSFDEEKLIHDWKELKEVNIEVHK